MSINQKAIDILNYIKANPDQTSADIVHALTAKYTQMEVTSALWTLWVGRRITRVRGEKMGGNGAKLFEYRFKTDNPRRRKWGTGPKAKPGAKPVIKAIPALPAYYPQKKEVKVTNGSGVEVKVLVTTSGITTRMTLAQAKELRKKLEELGA